MPDLRFLLKVSRPRFWIYIFGPYIVGLIAAVTEKSELLDWRFLTFGVFFTFPANLLIYGVNDTFDYETDKLNQKKVDYETLVGPESRTGLITAIVVSALPFFAALLFQNFVSIAAFALFLFFSIFYSAPPIQAKTKPFLDSAFNILYIMPGAFGYALVTGAFPPLSAIVAGGIWTAAMHAYSAIPDIEADRAARINTIATMLGPFGTLAVCSILYAASVVLAFEYLGFITIPLGAGYLILMLASVRSVKTGTLFKLYRAFPLINMAAGFIIFWNIAASKLLPL